jgi:hypothetical protein
VAVVRLGDSAIPAAVISSFCLSFCRRLFAEFLNRPALCNHTEPDILQQTRYAIKELSGPA